MSRILHVIAALLLASPAAAQQTGWGAAQRVDVTLSNFKFRPAVLHLRSGRPVLLHLTNASGGGHDFTAAKFFAAAEIRPEDRGAVRQGSVELEGHATRDIAVIPRAGRYPVKCTHTFHKFMGMSGEIVVD